MLNSSTSAGDLPDEHYRLAQAAHAEEISDLYRFAICHDNYMSREVADGCTGADVLHCGGPKDHSIAPCNNPSLTAADPTSERPRCGGMKSNSREDSAY